MKRFFQRIRKFFQEVSEEFWKCTRPSYAELKESTVVVVVTMSALGVIIFASDFVITRVLKFAIF